MDRFDDCAALVDEFYKHLIADDRTVGEAIMVIGAVLGMLIAQVPEPERPHAMTQFVSTLGITAAATEQTLRKDDGKSPTTTVRTVQ